MGAHQTFDLNLKPHNCVRGNLSNLITTAALIIASLALCTALMQRKEIKDLKVRVADEGKMDLLNARLLHERLAERQHIERLPAEFQRALEEFEPPATVSRLQQQIDGADLVLVTESQVRDGRIYQIVTKVIKLKAGALTNFDVGHSIDESSPLGESGRNPEGTLVFCSGQPATPRITCNIYNGRLGSYSELPASAAIKMIEQAAASDGDKPSN